MRLDLRRSPDRRKLPVEKHAERVEPEPAKKNPAEGSIPIGETEPPECKRRLLFLGKKVETVRPGVVRRTTPLKSIVEKQISLGPTDVLSEKPELLIEETLGRFSNRELESRTVYDERLRSRMRT
jgi:hypothetical protein